MATTYSTFMRGSTLFDRYQLSQKFQALKNENFIIHFFFAQGKPLETIIQFMEMKGFEQCKEYINSKYSEEGLTALHIAVFKEDEEGVKELCKRGANVNEEDKYGFTPWMHTAFLTNQTSIKRILKDNKAEIDEKAWHRLRARADLEESLAPSLEKLSIQQRKSERKVTSDNCKTKIGLDRYTDETIFAPPLHRHLWQLAPSGPVFFENIRKAIVSQSKGLYALTLRSNNLGRQDRKQDLYAAENIQPGTYLGNYGGEMELVEAVVPLVEQVARVNHNYWLVVNQKLRVNALKSGNAFRFSNDAWPNVSMQFSKDGVEVIALQKINAGEEITCNMGALYSLKWGRYVLTKKEEMKAYFKQNPSLKMASDWQILYNKLTEENSIYEDQIAAYTELLNLQEKLSYLFNTPLALIYLCIEESIRADDLLILLMANRSLSKILGINSDNRDHSLFIINLLFELKEINQLYQRLSDQVKPFVPGLFKTFLEATVGQYEVIHIMAGISALRTAMDPELNVFQNQVLAWSEKSLQVALESVKDHREGNDDFDLEDQSLEADAYCSRILDNQE